MQSSKLLPVVPKEKKRCRCAGCLPCCIHDALPKMLRALAVATVVAVIASIVAFPSPGVEAGELTNSTRSPTKTLSPHIAVRNATLSPAVTAGPSFVPTSQSANNSTYYRTIHSANSSAHSQPNNNNADSTTFASTGRYDASADITVTHWSSFVSADFSPPDASADYRVNPSSNFISDDRTDQN